MTTHRRDGRRDPRLGRVGRWPARLRGDGARALVLMAFFVVAAFDAGPVRAEGLRIGGTGSGVALLQRLAADYVAECPGTRMTFVTPSLGTSGGVRALRANMIDLAVLGRPLEEKERDPAFRVVFFARTPLVFATSGGALKEGLGLASLVDILEGRRATWDDGSKIRLVLRPPQDADMLILSALSPEVKQALDTHLSLPGAVTPETDLDAFNALCETAGSFGVTTLGMTRLYDNTLKLLAFEGTQPDPEALRTGRYPLSKDKYLVYKEPASPDVEAFLNWLRTPEATDALRRLGSLPSWP